MPRSASTSRAQKCRTLTSQQGGLRAAPSSLQERGEVLPGHFARRPPERVAVPRDPEVAARDREELRGLAEDLAEMDARLGDRRSAQRWLQTIEWLDGTPTSELAKLVGERRLGRAQSDKAP